MKRRELWKPSKYVMRGGSLLPSSDQDELAVSSRMIARLLTDKYQPAICQHARGLLLDLGCGKVPLYEAYQEYVTDNICVDWPSSAHGNIHVDVLCDLSRQLPFADESFDTVLSSDVIEHLPEPALAFAEMGRLLRPNGILLLNTPFLYMLHEIPHDYYRFTRYAIERLLKMSGMEVLRLEATGGAGAVMVDLLSKALASLPLLGAPLAILIQKLGSCLAGSPSESSPSARLPIGYFVVARKLEGLPSGGPQ